MTDKKKINWGNDKFTKMVKEFGTRIENISKDVEDAIKEMLFNDKAVDLFIEDNTSKKKEK